MLLSFGTIYSFTKDFTFLMRHHILCSTLHHTLPCTYSLHFLSIVFFIFSFLPPKLYLFVFASWISVSMCNNSCAIRWSFISIYIFFLAPTILYIPPTLTSNPLSFPFFICSLSLTFSLSLSLSLTHSLYFHISITVLWHSSRSSNYLGWASSIICRHDWHTVCS